MLFPFYLCRRLVLRNLAPKIPRSNHLQVKNWKKLPCLTNRRRYRPRCRWTSLRQTISRSTNQKTAFKWTSPSSLFHQELQRQPIRSSTYLEYLFIYIKRNPLLLIECFSCFNMKSIEINFILKIIHICYLRGCYIIIFYILCTLYRGWIIAAIYI